MIAIRGERPGDQEGIRTVNELAFGKPNEADIVDRLRETCPRAISLVAVKDGQIIGHILFTPATIETAEGSVEGMGLAPMAVLPDFQRQGVGSRLVRSGLDEMMQGQHPFVIVLGHPHYYPRFGFVPASRYEIVCEYENVPNEAFMIVVLQDAQVRKLAGVAKYHPEFASGV